MKRILGLAVAALLVMGLVGGGTWAYFTDTQTSSGNNFAAGTLDLQLTGGTSVADNVTGTWSTPTTWKPGDSVGPSTVTLANIGTIPIKTAKLTVAISNDGGNNRAGYTHASSDGEYITEGGSYTAGSPNNDSTPVDNISTKIDITLLKYNSVDLLAKTGDVFNNATIETADANDDHILQLSEFGTITNFDLVAAGGASDIPVSGSQDLQMTVQLQSGTLNAYQGDVAAMTLTIVAQQATS